MPKKKVIIIGGGPSALIAAYFLGNDYEVEIYEKEKNVGQKFLVAGKGGFNLTNSLTGIDLSSKYEPRNFLRQALINFDSQALRNWFYNLGIKTFVGTSGRIFAEKQHKPIEVLESIKQSLLKKNVKIYTSHKFTGFDKNHHPIITNNIDKTFIGDYYIFALGGASWSITGSDGKWLDSFNSIGIKTKQFEPSNCGININWPKNIIDHHIGKPLKNIEVSIENLKFRGEAVITSYGLEGNAIYPVVPKIREQIKIGNTNIFIDFKPNNTAKELLEKINNLKYVQKKYAKVLNLNTSEFALLKVFTSKDDFLSTNRFIDCIKCLPLKVDSLRPIEEAISSVGGIDVTELSKDFSLIKYPNIFVVGEMVDWDAPTGGFLLQGCFSMGFQAAKSILSKIQID